MTLGELATASKAKDVLIPNTLKDLEIENSEEFCRCKISKYLKSTQFKNDVILILDLLLKINLPLKGFSLKLCEIDNILKLDLTYGITEYL